MRNNLSATHAAEVVPRADSLASPPGRRGDQVSAVVLLTAADLRRLAPAWLKFSELVRADPMVRHRPSTPIPYMLVQPCNVIIRQ